MRTLAGSWILLALAATLAAKTPLPASKIQVVVYDYARVSPETLAGAERTAARIFKSAAIEVEWLDCPVTPEALAQTPECQIQPSPARLSLRVTPGTRSQWTSLPQGTFGFALFPEDGGFATAAVVCPRCAEALAHGSKTLHTALLGHVMAHELGHLLLGTGSHGASGLMHQPWFEKELQRIAFGGLLFTPEEARRMRRQIEARLAASTPPELAAATPPRP